MPVPCVQRPTSRCLSGYLTSSLRHLALVVANQTRNQRGVHSGAARQRRRPRGACGARPNRRRDPPPHRLIGPGARSQFTVFALEMALLPERSYRPAAALFTYHEIADRLGYVLGPAAGAGEPKLVAANDNLRVARTGPGPLRLRLSRRPVPRIIVGWDEAPRYAVTRNAVSGRCLAPDMLQASGQHGVCQPYRCPGSRPPACYRVIVHSLDDPHLWCPGAWRIRTRAAGARTCHVTWIRPCKPKFRFRSRIRWQAADG